MNGFKEISFLESLSRIGKGTINKSYISYISQGYQVVDLKELLKEGCCMDRETYDALAKARIERAMEF